MLQYVLALTTIIIFVVLICRKPRVETYVLYVLAALPLMDTKILPLEYGFVRTFDVITLISLFLFFQELIRFKGRQLYWGFLVLTILFWIFTLLSSLHSEFAITKPHLLYPSFTIFIYIRFVIVYCTKDWGCRYKLTNAFKKGFTAALIFMAIQMYIGLEFTFYAKLGDNVFNQLTGLTRYPGIMHDSQNNGQFLALGTFIFLIHDKSTKLKLKYLNYLGFVVSIIFVFLAASRSALGGLIVGLAILFIGTSTRVKVYITVLCVLSISFFLILSPDKGIFSRTETIDSDFGYRQSIWEETMSIIEDHPLMGIGVGNFEAYLTKYQQTMYIELSPGEFIYFDQPENGYLKVLVEQGVISFCLFLLFILIPFISSIKGLLTKSIDRNVIYFVAAISVWLVAFNTVYSLFDYRILIMIGSWLTLMIMHTRQQHNMSMRSSAAFKTRSDTFILE